MVAFSSLKKGFAWMFSPNPTNKKHLALLQTLISFIITYGLFAFVSGKLSNYF